MLSLILTLAMVPAATSTPVIAQPQQTAQVQTCVWPHVCAETPADVQPVLVAQVQTCVWPHVCSDAAAL